MSKFKEIIKEYNVINLSSTDLLKAICYLYPAIDYVEEHDCDSFWKAMKGFHEHIKGKHFDEMYATHQVNKMFHTKRNGSVCKGEIYDINIAKSIYEKYIRNINSSYTCWDVYVAINSQYHDYIKMYNDWYGNITNEDMDDKIISSAIIFWFKDEDSDCGKIWDYFNKY